MSLLFAYSLHADLGAVAYPHTRSQLGQRALESSRMAACHPYLGPECGQSAVELLGLFPVH